MAKKRTGLVLFIIAVVIIAFSYGAIKYTSTAKFCGSCKNTMGLAYKTWAASTHGSERNPEIKHHHECMACHSAVGVIGYGKAKAAGMLSVYYQLTGQYKCPLKGHKPVYCGDRQKCHVKIEEIKEEKIVVNHPKHTKLMKEKFECMPCHEGVAHGGADDLHQRPLRPEHKVCSECHTDLKNCELCHKGYKGLNLSAHCTRPECHANLELIKEEEIKVKHPEHVKVMNGECKPCHKGHKKQGYALGDHNVCSKCHDVSADCKFCHKKF